MKEKISNYLIYGFVLRIYEIRSPGNYLSKKSDYYLY